MDVAPYVWIAEPASAEHDAAPRPATAAEEARLARWAKPRGASLVRPAPSPRGLPPADNAWLDATETDLATARDALAALDVAAVEAALSRADARLIGHPEIPAAAFLRAEVLRVWAARYARIEPKDDAKAARAWQSAAALDGGRVAGVGETSVPAPERRAVRIAWPHGDGDVLTIDGVRITSGSVSLAAGEHAVVIEQAGEIKLASWMTPADDVLTLPSFTPPPCSEGDLRAVKLRSGGLDASGVTCPRYFVVVEPAHAIAQCRGARCGTPAPFGAPPAALAAVPAAPPPSKSASSPWLTWSAIGAAAVLAGGSFFLASGVLDRPERRERWVSGGLRTE